MLPSTTFEELQSGRARRYDCARRQCKDFVKERGGGTKTDRRDGQREGMDRDIITTFVILRTSTLEGRDAVGQPSAFLSSPFYCVTSPSSPGVISPVPAQPPEGQCLKLFSASSSAGSNRLAQATTSVTGAGPGRPVGWASTR